MFSISRFLWFLCSVAAAHPHVFHPCGRRLQRQPPAGPGGRAGRLLSDWAPASDPIGSAGQHGQHRLLQLCRDQRHQRDQRHHPHGAGQPAHASHLGGEHGAGLGAVSQPAGAGLPGPAAWHGALQWTAPPRAGQDTVLRRDGGGRGGEQPGRKSETAG